jgi:hypothetical protein
VQYLTADATLDDWAHLSLKERAIMFHRQFPELHVSPTLIRRVYSQFKIGFKSIRRTKPPIQIQGGYYGDLFQKMVASLDEARAKGLKVFYLDETVFSFSTFPTRTWYSKHNNVCIPEKTYRFKTQAVVAAVSHENGMEDFLCADGAIATKDFVFFLELLHRKNGGQPYALFLDNLKVHTSKDTTKAMQTLGIMPIFNVPYSPQFNGIEAVFSIVKANFKKELLR